MSKCTFKKYCNNDNCNVCYERSFASHEKSKYWSDKNELKPRQVAKFTHNKYLFNCDCGHEILIALAKVSDGYWCSYCCYPPRSLCDNDNCNNCFEKSFASMDKSKYWSNKNQLKPRQVFKSSAKKYLFDCDCGHEFPLILNDCNAGNWCSYCANPPKKLCDDNNCQKCFEKSFASNEKSKYWSSKNKLIARQVFKGSANKYIFNCKCGHEISTSLADINSGGWCGYCSSTNLCNNNDCKNCYNKSFASNKKSKYWSNKNKLKPRQIFKCSGNKYLFNCKCGHEFEGRPDFITRLDVWCPYCSNPPKLLCNNNDCSQCFEKSFASHDKAKFWSDKNELKPREIFKSSANKFYLNCEYGHEIYMTPANIKTGFWCSICMNKTERKLNEILINDYPLLKQQFRTSWCKNKMSLPFDFVLEDIKIIIELDGGQHFKQVRDWKSPEEQQKTDKYKMTCANNNGFSVIRILQEDVFNDSYNWLEELKNNIERIKNEGKIQNIYMCKNNEYDVFN